MQYDWQQGVDISTLSVQRLPASFESLIFEMTVIDSPKIDVFKQTSLAKLSENLPDKQTCVTLTQTDQVKPLRGSWSTNFIIVNQWKSSKSFYKWFDSDLQV